MTDFTVYTPEQLAEHDAATSKRYLDALREVQAKIAALEKDAVRMDWIQQNVLCADFEYPLSDATTPVLCIKWPAKIGVSANVRASIDAAMKGGA